MMRQIAILSCALVARVRAHGQGVWKDPNHYVSDNSMAGLRFISEYPAHTLDVVGTDDGKAWWALKGTCSGEGMTEINLDFSPKGGPKGVVGTWAKGADGAQTITFPDGNVWSLLTVPTAAFATADLTDSPVGVFTDPNHYAGPESWAGLRVIAEFPSSQLKMVGSDDGDVLNFWYLEGTLGGSSRAQLHFDFSPKGGPADLVGKWSKTGLVIAWPDGNSWARIGAAGNSGSALKTARASNHSGARFGVFFVLIAVAALGLAYRSRDFVLGGSHN
jgi:hypothetical protein